MRFRATPAVIVYAAREVIAAPINPMVGKRAARPTAVTIRPTPSASPGVQGSIDALQDRLQHPGGTQRDAGDEKHSSHAGGLDEVAAEGDAKDLRREQEDRNGDRYGRRKGEENVPVRPRSALLRRLRLRHPGKRRERDRVADHPDSDVMVQATT